MSDTVASLSSALNPAPVPGAEPPPPGEAPTPGSRRRDRSLWSDAVRGLVRNPVFVIAAVMVLAILSMALFPGLWTSTDPRDCDLVNSRKGSAPGHPFGFTVQGCDLYAQTIHGARPSVTIAVVCTVGTTLIGIVLGTLAAYFGGRVDTLISRLTDIFLGLPFVLGGILVLSMIGSHSIWAVSAILIVLGWGSVTRIMRGSVLSIMGIDYVSAARAMGATNRRIIMSHVIPNAISPVIVVATLALGGFVSAEATLTFLGVGLQLPDISWGLLISNGQSYAIAGYPHLLIWPCLFLVITTLGFILIGDALRDALDPKLR